jgi:hypothetical protein
MVAVPPVPPAVEQFTGTEKLVAPMRVTTRDPLTSALLPDTPAIVTVSPVWNVCVAVVSTVGLAWVLLVIATGVPSAVTMRAASGARQLPPFSRIVMVRSETFAFLASSVTDIPPRMRRAFNVSMRRPGIYCSFNARSRPASNRVRMASSSSVVIPRNGRHTFEPPCVS